MRLGEGQAGSGKNVPSGKGGREGRRVGGREGRTILVVLEQLHGGQVVWVLLGADGGGHDGGALPVARLVH